MAILFLAQALLGFEAIGHWNAPTDQRVLCGVLAVNRFSWGLRLERVMLKPKTKLDRLAGLD